MHEMSLAMHIVDLAASRAQQEGASRVSAIELEVGAMAGVMVEALEFCFEAAARNTVVEGATLATRLVEGRGTCLTCGVSHLMVEVHAICPSCGGSLLHDEGGMELRLRSITIDD